MELMKNGHLTEQSLDMFKDCRLSDEQLIALADHIACCELCAGRLASAAEHSPHYGEAPAGIGSIVAHKIEDERAQKQRQFRNYCLKVAGCAAAALILVFGGFLRWPSLPQPNRDPKAAPTPQYQLAAPAPQPTDPGEQQTLLGPLGDYFTNIFGSKE